MPTAFVAAGAAAGLAMVLVVVVVVVVVAAAAAEHVACMDSDSKEAEVLTCCCYNMLIYFVLLRRIGKRDGGNNYQYNVKLHKKQVVCPCAGGRGDSATTSRSNERTGRQIQPVREWSVESAPCSRWLDFARSRSCTGLALSFSASIWHLLSLEHSRNGVARKQRKYY